MKCAIVSYGLTALFLVGLVLSVAGGMPPYVMIWQGIAAGIFLVLGYGFQRKANDV